MALDRQKKLQNAERLLKQGKVDAALVEMEALAAGAPNDVLTLNRIGDLLAKQGRRRQAVSFYRRIADHFTRAGFLPKAVAIHKKILRLDPDGVDSLVQLGDLYHQQKLAGDARAYFLKAGDCLLSAGNFRRAREVYDRLVAAEPHDPRHRARLAEAMFAEGRPEDAAGVLMALGDSLLDAGNAEDAERVFRRAGEMLPGRTELRLRLARSACRVGRHDEALAELDAIAAELGAEAVVGDRAVCLVHAGRRDDAFDLLERAVPAVPDDAVVRAFAALVGRGEADEAWSSFDGLASRWQEREGAERLARLYDRLAGLEDPEHVPALERLVRLHERQPQGSELRASLQRLARALHEGGHEDRARDVESRLEALGPQPSAPAEPPAPPAPEPYPEPAVAGPAPVPLAASDGDVLPIEVEAPAVPLNRAEEEQVAGRLTQAEILDKYGLRSQAVEQVREVVHRFPGHVAAHERLLEMLREAGEAEEIRDALVGLALALRASGDADGAGRYARDAATVAPLDPARRDVLVRLGLIEGEPAPPVPAKPSSGAGPVADGAVLIDFDAVEADGADVAAAPEPVAASAPASVSASAPDADEDLRAIAAALEDELFADDASPVPEVETEQSIGDVFAAFRKQVEQQVDQDDYRTHYDLGIAYKEMGLVDEAIEEFRRASSSPEFGREAFAMMALCHRAQADAGEAARCYLRAIEISNGDAGTVCQLRYELAEVLLEAGDRSAALDQFRSLLDADPGFRDVRDRVAELETVS